MMKGSSINTASIGTMLVSNRIYVSRRRSWAYSRRLELLGWGAGSVRGYASFWSRIGLWFEPGLVLLCLPTFPGLCVIWLRVGGRIGAVNAGKKHDFDLRSYVERFAGFEDVFLSTESGSSTAGGSRFIHCGGKLRKLSRKSRYTIIWGNDLGPDRYKSDPVQGLFA